RYRGVPRDAPETYPFSLDFGGADFPWLVNGFMERPPEAQTRWIGAIVTDDEQKAQQEWLDGIVRLPKSDKQTDTLALTLTARAPREGTRLELKNGAAIL